MVDCWDERQWHSAGVDRKKLQWVGQMTATGRFAKVDDKKDDGQVDTQTSGRIIATRESHVHMLPLLHLLVQTILLFIGDSNINGLMITSSGTSGQHLLNLGVKTPYEPLLFLMISTKMF